MEVKLTNRRFEYLEGADVRQSSAVGDYDDALGKPGSSALWIDGEHCFREDVAELLGCEDEPEGTREHLLAWLETGSLRLPERPA